MGTIKELGLKFESSTIKTVGGDRSKNKAFFSYYIEDQIGENGGVHRGDPGESIDL